jgi:hypothetical protein
VGGRPLIKEVEGDHTTTIAFWGGYDHFRFASRVAAATLELLCGGHNHP